MKTTKIVLLLLLTLSLGIIPVVILNYSSFFPVQTTSATPEGSLLKVNAWENNGTAICTESHGQGYPQVCSDGAGGAIITWMDSRGSYLDIYAQRISAAGAVQWKTDGAVVCAASYGQANPQLCSDGAGGAIITWMDQRNISTWDIYARRISAVGEVQWTTNGVAISTANDVQNMPRICSDGAGGAIIIWEDYRNNAIQPDIYAQRISAAGAVQWTTNGVAICTASNIQILPQICSDKAGGAYIIWEDWRNGVYPVIYAQRINAAGAVQWPANGVAICTASDSQRFPQICCEFFGSAVITWQENRSGNLDIYAQRITLVGVIQWTANGVALCTASQDQESPQICGDMAGGAIITWMDYRSESDWDIYIQWINLSGVVQWTANGVAICTAINAQSYPQVCSDGAEGAIITWYDSRSGSNYDIYAQWITAAGAVQWTANGVALCTADQEQQDPQICSDGAGGAYIIWEDSRSGSVNIYATRIVKATGSPIPFPFYSVILAFGVLTTIFAIARFKLQRMNGERQF